MTVALVTSSVLPRVRESDAPASLMLSLVGAVVSVGLVGGALTPLAAGCAAVLLLLEGSHAASWSQGLPAVIDAGSACALLLIGPGRPSVDARLFGHREVVVSRAPRA